MRSFVGSGLMSGPLPPAEVKDNIVNLKNFNGFAFILFGTECDTHTHRGVFPCLLTPNVSPHRLTGLVAHPKASEMLKNSMR